MKFNEITYIIPNSWERGHQWLHVSSRSPTAAKTKTIVRRDLPPLMSAVMPERTSLQKWISPARRTALFRKAHLPVQHLRQRQSMSSVTQPGGTPSRKG